MLNETDNAGKLEKSSKPAHNILFWGLIVWIGAINIIYYTVFALKIPSIEKMFNLE